MPTTKPAKALETTGRAKQFSLVPSIAQHRMYKALADLKPIDPTIASGAEVAEIAACTAIGENDPVILACQARGSDSVRSGHKIADTNGGRLTAATISAVSALLSDPKATALICAGKFEANEDYLSALKFAARHKLPILFLMANTLTPGRRQELDLRPLYAELGIPVFSVDANDAIAAYRVTTEALHNARYLRGPCVIEALTVISKASSATALELLRNYMERHGNLPR
jgi:hypothetical protein